MLWEMESMVVYCEEERGAGYPLATANKTLSNYLRKEDHAGENEADLA